MARAQGCYRNVINYIIVEFKKKRGDIASASFIHCFHAFKHRHIFLMFRAALSSFRSNPTRIGVSILGGALLLTVLTGCTSSKTLRMNQINQEGYFQAVNQATSSKVAYDYSSRISAGKATPYTKGYEKQYDSFTVLLEHDMPGRVDSLTQQYLKKRTSDIDSTSSTTLTVQLRDFKRSKWVPGDTGSNFAKALSGEEVTTKYATKMSVAVQMREEGTVRDSTTIQVETETEAPAGSGDKSSTWETLIGKMNIKYMDALGKFLEKNEM